MDNITGKITLTNLCFSHFEFSQDTEKKGPLKLNYGFKVTYKKTSEKSQLVKIIVKITGEDNRLNLNIEEQAHVELVNEELLDENTQKTLLNQNSVAIMFPYLRSQVALLTSQPGLNTVQLPIIDVSQLIKTATYED